MPSSWTQPALMQPSLMSFSRQPEFLKALQDPWARLLKIPAPALLWPLRLALSTSAFCLLLTEHQPKATLPGTLEPALNHPVGAGHCCQQSLSRSRQVTHEVLRHCVLTISSISQRRRSRQREALSLGWGTGHRQRRQRCLQFRPPQNRKHVDALGLLEMLQKRGRVCHGG